MNGELIVKPGPIFTVRVEGVEPLSNVSEPVSLVVKEKAWLPL